MHQGQVTDGPNMTFALRHLPKKGSDIVASTAFRHGWNGYEIGERGHLIGIVFDFIELPKLSPIVRGNYYCQFRQNSNLDFGLGGEFGIWPPVVPIMPYAVISKNMSTHFTVYSEVKIAVPFIMPLMIFPTVGLRTDISPFTFFTESNLAFIWHEPPVPGMGLGIGLHQ